MKLTWQNLYNDGMQGAFIEVLGWTVIVDENNDWEIVKLDEEVYESGSGKTFEGAKKKALAVLTKVVKENLKAIDKLGGK